MNLNELILGYNGANSSLFYSIFLKIGDKIATVSLSWGGAGDMSKENR